MTEVWEERTIHSGNEKNQKLVLHSILSVAAVSLQKVLDVDAVWEVFDTGEICVTMRVKKEMEFPELPRFGIRLF